MLVVPRGPRIFAVLRFPPPLKLAPNASPLNTVRIPTLTAQVAVVLVIQRLLVEQKEERQLSVLVSTPGKHNRPLRALFLRATMLTTWAAIVLLKQRPHCH